MPNSELTRAVENFSTLMLPVSEKDLERNWVWKDHDEEGIRFAFFVILQELRQLALELSTLLPPPTPAQRILGKYHAQYMDLQAAIFGLSEVDSNRAPSEGEWSVREAYAHMLGADIGFSIVVRYALEGHRAGTWTPERMSDEDENRIAGMSEEEFQTLVKGPFEGMLAYHRKFHPAIIKEFSEVTDQELDLPSAFWEETRFPIRHRLHRYEAHIVQHTVQIDKTLVAIGLAPSETKRLIRYLFAALAEVDANLIGKDDIQEGCTTLAKAINSRTAEIKSVLEK